MAVVVALLAAPAMRNQNDTTFKNRKAENFAQSWWCEQVQFFEHWQIQQPMLPQCILQPNAMANPDPGHESSLEGPVWSCTDEKKRRYLYEGGLTLLFVFSLLCYVVFSCQIVHRWNHSTSCFSNRGVLSHCGVCAVSSPTSPHKRIYVLFCISILQLLHGVPRNHKFGHARCAQHLRIFHSLRHSKLIFENPLWPPLDGHDSNQPSLGGSPASTRCAIHVGITCEAILCHKFA